MSLSTCMNCLNGTHRRCEDRGFCGCSICGKPGNKASRDPFEDLPKPAVHRPKAKSRIVKQRELSTDPKVIAKREYTREYRQRKREGGVIQERRRLTDDDKAEIIRLRTQEGHTALRIGVILNIPKSSVQEHISRTLGKQTPMEVRKAKALREARGHAS